MPQLALGGPAPETEEEMRRRAYAEIAAEEAAQAAKFSKMKEDILKQKAGAQGTGMSSAIAAPWPHAFPGGSAPGSALEAPGGGYQAPGVQAFGGVPQSAFGVHGNSSGLFPPGPR